MRAPATLLITLLALAALVTVPLVAADEAAPQTPAPHQEAGCSVDLMLVLDGSASISAYNFFLMQEFVVDLIGSYTVGPADANVGLVQFSDAAELYLPLSDDPAAVQAAIDRMFFDQMSGQTNITAGIELAQQQFVTRREGIPRVIMVLTDGLHNREGNPITAADRARAAGTAVLGIAVGDFDITEIIDIAGGDQNTITIGSFEGLATIIDILRNQICAVVTLPGADALPSDATPAPDAPPQVAYATPEPGQTRLAFASDRDGDFEIYVVHEDGSNLQQLTANNVDDDKPSWSKDGRFIAWESAADGDFDIYVMASDGTGQIKLTDNDANDWGPAWSPDGTQIAFHSDRDGDVEVFVMDADGGNVRQITQNAGAVDRSPTWSPDGLEVLYYGDASGGRELYRTNIRTGRTLRLTENAFYDGQPDWSLNGTGVIFGSTRGGSDSEIYIMRIDGTNIQRLTENPATDDDPIWSPDGRRIAFESDRAGNFDIWVMNADGSGLRQVTDDPATDWSPDWMFAATE